MKGVILDAASVGKDLDLGPITDCLDEWQVYQSTSPEEVAERIRDADVVLTNKVRLMSGEFQNADRLKLVGLLATGTNNIDLEAAKSRGVCVCNAVSYATPSVAQHAISLMLALATNLLSYVEDVQQGVWHKSESFCLNHHPIIELSGKKLGIIGYGTLGREVARIAKAMGMKVLICQRPGSEPQNKRIPLDELLGQVDVLSLHCPLTNDNSHLINSDSLELMKPSALLINTARGGLVDSAALIDALKDQQIAGAAIDVLDIEPPASTEPLLNVHLPNLIVTPHNAWCAIESRQRLVEQVRDYILAFLSGHPLNRVT
jgi:glycerate dehydrogenase